MINQDLESRLSAIERTVAAICLKLEMKRQAFYAPPEQIPFFLLLQSLKEKRLGH